MLKVAGSSCRDTAYELSALLLSRVSLFLLCSSQFLGLELKHFTPVDEVRIVHEAVLELPRSRQFRFLGMRSLTCQIHCRNRLSANFLVLVSVEVPLVRLDALQVLHLHRAKLVVTLRGPTSLLLFSHTTTTVLSADVVVFHFEVVIVIIRALQILVDVLTEHFFKISFIIHIVDAILAGTVPTSTDLIQVRLALA